MNLIGGKHFLRKKKTYKKNGLIHRKAPYVTNYSTLDKLSQFRLQQLLNVFAYNVMC